MADGTVKRQKIGTSSTGENVFTVSHMGFSLPICHPFKHCRCTQVGSPTSEDHEQPKDLVTIADDAINSLSEAERDRVYNDLYGTADAIQETEDFVVDKLQQLDLALDEISMEEKADYLLALDEEEIQGKKYIRSVKFRLMFLRSERFNTEAAASRLCRFFTKKKELFGIEKLPQRIVQADLDENDKEALLSGAFFIRNGIDHCNRMMFFYRRQQLYFRHMLNLQRAWFYYILASMEDNEEAQRMGVITIMYSVPHVNHVRHNGHKLNKFEVMKQIKQLNSAMPFRIATQHHCFNDFKVLFLVSWFLKLQAAFNTARYQSHFGTHQHCRREMIKYGIRVDYFPVDQRGNYDIDMLLRLLKRLRRKEEQQGSSFGESFSNSSTIGDGNADDDSSVGSY